MFHHLYINQHKKLLQNDCIQPGIIITSLSFTILYTSDILCVICIVKNKFNNYKNVKQYNFFNCSTMSHWWMISGECCGSPFIETNVVPFVVVTVFDIYFYIEYKYTQNQNIFN